VLVRGRRLDGPGLVRFGRGRTPASELRIAAGTRADGPVGSAAMRLFHLSIVYLTLLFAAVAVTALLPRLATRRAVRLADRAKSPLRMTWLTMAAAKVTVTGGLAARFAG